MASIRTRNGKLFMDFYYTGVRCREQTDLDDSVLNRRKLERLLNAITQDINLGIFVYRDVFPHSSKAAQFTDADEQALIKKQHNVHLVTDRQQKLRSTDFAAMALDWYETNLCRWQPGYQYNIRLIINSYLIPTFGSQQLHEINRAAILQFRAELAALKPEKSADFVNHVMGTLRMILAEGAARYNLPAVFTNIKTLRIAQSEVNPFTLPQMKQLIETVRADFKNYYIVRFLTGMRTGEIDGLQWKYVDFDRRQILVREAITNGKLGPLKTPSSRREIDMSTPVYEALLEQYEMTGKTCPFVFCNTANTPLDHRNVRDRIWAPLLKQLKIPYRRPYETRHTTATLWLAAGENPEWIARQLGHANTQMLFRVYSRFVPNLTRQDGASFEQLLKSHRDKKG
jgi:integrase